MRNTTPLQIVAQQITRSSGGVRGGIRVGMMRGVCVFVSCAAIVVGSASGGEAPEKKSARPAKQRSAQPTQQPTRKAAPKPTRRATPKRAAPKRAAHKRVAPKRAAPKRAAPKRVAPKRAAPKRTAPKPAARPTSPTRRVTPTRPTSTRPTTRPTTRPAVKPATRPAAKPTSTRPRQTSKSVNTVKRPVWREVPVDSVSPANRTPNAGASDTSRTLKARETAGGRRFVESGKKKGVRRLSTLKDASRRIAMNNKPTISVGPGNPGAGKSVVTVGEVPVSFAPENAIPIKRAGGSKTSTGLSGTGVVGGGDTGGSDGLGDDAGDFDDGFEDGYDDGFDDGYDEGYDDGYDDEHGNHHNHGYSTHGHHSGCYYCTNSWYLVIHDYNGDGYFDYAFTNSYYTVWYYGGGYNGGGYGYTPGGLRFNYSYSFSSGFRGGYGYFAPYRYRGAVYGPDQEFVSEPEGEEVAVEPEAGTYEMSPIEVARLMMSVGALDDAIDAYTAYLDEYPDDWFAVRELGIAKVMGHKYIDGIALIHYAYSSDPDLAAAPLEMVLFEESESVLRDSVVDLVRWGHKNSSAGAWLGVAALMQAQERDAVAMKMIDRAEDHGLSVEIINAMRDQLHRY
ncbi:MAG: hypothetical protein JKY96_06310 [Phycisphaerales bacterium]|nr:hypothetical protein [Phycisphaerales bacterium]